LEDDLVDDLDRDVLAERGRRWGHGWRREEGKEGGSWECSRERKVKGDRVLSLSPLLSSTDSAEENGRARARASLNRKAGNVEARAGWKSKWNKTKTKVNEAERVRER